jgi:hypothetical protein
MRRRQEDIRVELMAEAETLVDEWLAWQEGRKEPTLTEMEDVVLMLRERLGRRMLELMVTEQETVKPEVAPRCEQCGKVMTYKGQKKRGVGTRAGALAVERAHYYCPRCESGLFPPGPAVGDGGGVLE